LVGRVMVDVHAGILGPALCEVGQELSECEVLLRPVVCPKCAEYRFRVAHRCLDDAEQILKTPRGRTLLSPKRVSLEIEEDITWIGRGECCQRFGIDDDAVHGIVARAPRWTLRYLQGRLLTQPVPGLLRHAQPVGTG